MPESVAAKIRRNTRVSTLCWGWGQALQFIRIPIVFAFLDADGYGLWLFAFSIMSYLGFYMGIADAFIKYTAEYHARKDYGYLSELLSTGLLISLIVGAAAGAFFLLGHDWIISFFDIAPGKIAETRFVLIGIGLATSFSMTFSVYRAVLVGIQRLDIANVWRVLWFTIDFFLAVALLYAGLGVRALVLSYGVNVIGVTLVQAIYLRRLLPELHLKPWRAARRCVAPMFSLGFKMQLLSAVAILVATIDGLVFTKYEGLAFYGAYGIARTFANRAQSAVLQGFGALAPASADLMARQETDALRSVYSAAMRITLIICAYLFGFIAINADYTMMFFMGADKYNLLSVLALRFLCLAFTIHTLTGPGTSMLRGAGKPALEITYTLFTLAFFLGLFAFARCYQSESLIVLSPFPSALPSPPSASSFSPTATSRPPSPPPGLKPFCLALSAPTLALLLRLAWNLLDAPLPFTRFGALAVIVVLGTPYTLLFALSLWRLPGLPPEDKDQLIRFIPKGRQLLARFQRGSGK